MNFQPLNDLILVKPETTVHEGLIFVPDTAKGKHSHQPGDPDSTFIGVVVATGPGDKLLHGVCGNCGHATTVLAIHKHGFHRCFCGAPVHIVSTSRAPMQTKVGDRVLFTRRPNTPGDTDGIWIEGQHYMLFNEEQSALAIVG